MINLQNLVNNQSNWAGWWSTKDKAFYFDWTNDYIAWNGNLWNGVAIAWSDGNGQYMQCYNTGFDVWPLSIDNRSVQTIKRRGSFDSFANTPVCFGYWGWSFTTTTLSVKADWKLQVEVQGTWSARINWNTVLTVWTEYNIIARVNNTLPSWTARVITDIDIFINWVKETLAISVTWNSTVTASQAYWGAYSTTLWMTWKMRSLDIWNIALTDWQCGTEGVSSSVVNTTGYLKGFRPADVHASIWRVWYDAIVSGLVTSGSDWDWSYFHINWNNDGTIPQWSSAQIVTTSSYTLNQTTSFTISAKFKFKNVIPSWWATGIFWRNFIISIFNQYSAWSNMITWRIRNWWTLTDVTYVASINTVYVAHLVFDSSINKMFCYLNGTLQNVWWTTVATATFWWSQNTAIGDNAIWWWNTKSASLYVYNAYISLKAMTQTEVTADVALWNTIKTDKSIIAYYIPENFAYNTQFCLNPKDLSNASWTKWSVTTVTADYGTAPDGTTTADRVMRTGVWGITANKVDTTFTQITGASLASKVLYVKAFVRAVGANCPFRLRCSHSGVADYYSGDLTATSVVQEFTFTQTFTSGTGGTWVTAWLVVDSVGLVADMEVRNVRCFFGNEYLHDEAPNMSDLIGWKTPTVLSARVQVATDPADASDAGCVLLVPRFYFHIRSGTLQPIARYDNALAGVQANVGALGAGYRSTFHIVAYKYWNGTNWSVKIYLNGVLIQTTTQSTTLRPPTTIYWNSQRLGRKWSTYFNAYIQRAKVHIPTSRVDGDAVKLYNGQEPANASKVLEYKPKANEAGLVTKDRANNNNNWQLIWGVERRNF